MKIYLMGADNQALQEMDIENPAPNGDIGSVVLMYAGQPFIHSESEPQTAGLLARLLRTREPGSHTFREATAVTLEPSRNVWRCEQCKVLRKHSLREERFTDVLNAECEHCHHRTIVPDPERYMTK